MAPGCPREAGRDGPWPYRESRWHDRVEATSVTADGKGLDLDRFGDPHPPESLDQFMHENADPGRCVEQCRRVEAHLHDELQRHRPPRIVRSMAPVLSVWSISSRNITAMNRRRLTAAP